MRHRHATALLVTGLVLLLGAPLAWQLGRQDRSFGEAPLARSAPRSEAPEVAPPASQARPAPQGTGGSPTTSPGPSPSPRTMVGTRSARLSGQELPDDPTAEPVQVRIPSLDIEAPVRPVGVIAATGELEIPEDVRVAGWYRYGAAPGAPEGSAVLSSHVDSRRQGPGAFFPLADAEEGTEVQVELADGTTVTYAIRARQRYEKALLPSADLFARDGRHRLVLITCGGPFDADIGRYRDNVVVIAEPVPDA